VALFQRLLMNPAAAHPRQDTAIRAMVIAPTRELAVQIDKDARQMRASTPVPHRRRLRRRRLRQAAQAARGRRRRPDRHARPHHRLLKQHVFELALVQAVVLDEADRMFDLGFIKSTSASCCASCRRPSSASRCCSRRRCRTACWSSPTST
jgi:ATP-dependent RNA helicase RhlB